MAASRVTWPSGGCLTSAAGISRSLPSRAPAPGRGEDLFQAAPGRLLHNWNRIGTGPESYLRRILFGLTAGGAGAGLPSSVRRRAWGPGGVDIAAVDLRNTLVRLLRHLPPRQTGRRGAAVRGTVH